MSRTLVLAVASLVLATVAEAQPKTAADAAFKRGRELVKAGKYADACVEFEHSQKLDPALGTEFNIAGCSEKIGKLARALELYRHMLPRDTNAERKKLVAEAIPQLEARVPKLVIKVPVPAPAGLAITVQPQDAPARPIAANQPLELDLGAYAIVVKATGAPDWTETVRIDTEGKTTTLEPPLAPLAAQQQPAAVPLHAAPRTSNRKRYSYVALGVGGGALVTGIVFGSLASSKWSEAKDVCGGTTCTSEADLARANELGDRARGRATLSTVFVVAGTAVATAGVILFVTAPRSEHETRVTAVPTRDGGAISLSGRF